MADTMDLQSLKAIFKDDRTHIDIAKILKLGVADDRSCLRCLVSVGVDELPFVAKMSWDMTGFRFPTVGDMVLIAFIEGHEDDCTIVKNFTSESAKIPTQALSGDTVISSVPGKNVWMVSDGKILLAKGEAIPTEPVVLGNQLVALLSAILDKLASLSETLSTHTHTGNLGYPTSPPTEQSQIAEVQSFFNSKKSDPVDNKAILSVTSFTD